MNKEIEIPEGYEARIEGNKVILERKEGEDERIRQELIEYLIHRADVTVFVNETNDCKRYIDYLEKQKEQKPLSTEETELNSIAFLEQMGYTCIPPRKEQKPASGNSEKPNNHAEWSKEDENTLNDAITAVDMMLTDNYKESHPNLFKAFLTAKSWLKSLPERFNLQPKQEWSETDKLHLNNAILVAKKEWGVNSYTARFLESLRDNCKKCNNHWKPSEEQMKALGIAIRCGIQLGTWEEDALNSLRNDLKNL